MQVLVDLLKLTKTSICTCESFTGGMFASQLCNIASVSEVYRGSIVAYSRQVKKDVLKIDPALLDEYGTVSVECVKEMALKTRDLLKADICLAFTGIAGPDSVEDKAIGLYYICLYDGSEYHIIKGQTSGSRLTIRELACVDGFNLAINYLRNKP
jgi:PncC family amidohydrolase